LKLDRMLDSVTLLLHNPSKLLIYGAPDRI